MARLLYTLALYLATPAILLRLLWRSRRQPEYRRHLGERWGYYTATDQTPLLWLHAVSVGEMRAAAPLVARLREACPGQRILLTCMTPTGRATAQDLYGENVLLAYLPYDQPGAVYRFLRHFRPEIGILMETEIWPNLLAACHNAGIPVVLANARLSERSARGYRRLAALSRPALAQLAAVAAQTEADSERLRQLGAREVTVCGNIKFDVAPTDELIALGKAWRETLGNRPVWLAASTREGEETRVLEAWRQIADRSALLVLVPRHPQRFASVAEELRQQGIACKRRSQGLPDADTAVWLGDSMGEMAAYYTLADLAFIGGSLLPLGGQNLIEAAACGCPVLIGPHTFNFAQATEDALRAGCARRVADPAELAQGVAELLADRAARTAMAEAARRYAAAHRGATERTWQIIARQRDRAAR